MLTRHTRDAITWVDLESPTRQELQNVMAEFNINARIEEEIVSPTPYPLVVASQDYLYLILHFPTSDPHGGARNQEIDFIVGKHFVITARYEVVSSIHNLHKVFEAEDLLGLPGKHIHGSALVEKILRQLYGAIREEVEDTAHLLERIEDDIFSSKERETVLSISLIGRLLLRFDTILAHHREPLHSFLLDLCKPEFFGKEFAEPMRQIEAEHDHAISLVSSYRDVATELRNTNDSLLSSAQNDIIKRLTIITTAAFPVTIITGIFSMSNENLPFNHSTNGFYLVIALMAITVVLFVSYFKRNKWF
jgi:magnesium transporter